MTIAARIAPNFQHALTTASTVTIDDIMLDIEWELCLLYIHLFRREAFGRLESQERDDFMRSLVVAVARQLKEIKEPTDEISIESFWDGFLADCDARDEEYNSYETALPEPGDSPANTLFWEFGKKMGFTYQGYNFFGVQLFVLAAISEYVELWKAIGSKH